MKALNATAIMALVLCGGILCFIIAAKGSKSQPETVAESVTAVLPPQEPRLGDSLIANNVWREWGQVLYLDSAEKPPWELWNHWRITDLAIKTASNFAPGDEIVTSGDIRDHPGTTRQTVLGGFFSRIKIQDLTPYSCSRPDPLLLLQHVSRATDSVAFRDSFAPLPQSRPPVGILDE